MPPVIAFCTTCKGRAQHIKETLPRNLADNVTPYSKFILLNYNSDDDLLHYILTYHMADLRSGKLVLYSFLDEVPFHLSHAKNMAARLGMIEGADILCTLDADNFTGYGFDSYIIEKMKEPGVFLCPNFPLIRSLPYGPERPQRGFAGRLVLRAQEFIKAGGYDETFDTWRGEDIDMLMRLQRMGYTMRHIDNKYLNAIPHNAEVRFKYYPAARQYENKEAERLIAERTGTVVNYGNIGVGTVYRNDDSIPMVINPLPTRVFGIGLHKTATTSLHKAFQILGFDSLHWGTGEAPRIWNEMLHVGKSETLERFYSACDLPIPLLYKQLDKAYPGSKFILTIRDEDKWLKSVEGLYDPDLNPTHWTWNTYPITNRLHTALYGRTDFDPTTMIERYRRHNNEVMDYFLNRPQDLLVMWMDNGAGWPDLCNFLRISIPEIPYPFLYVTRNRRGDECFTTC